MKLTETELKKMARKAPEKHMLHSDDLTPNLYVKHYAGSGRMSFVYRARTGSQWEVVTIGVFPALSLDAARRKAVELNSRREGNGTGMTFGELLDAWFAARVEPRYKRTANVETYVTRGKAQPLGNKQLAVLTTRALVVELQAYAAKFPVAANRCLSNWKLALDYAVECGYLEANPLARTTARAVGGEEQSRDRTLTDEEIRQVWSWEGPHAALLRFLLLTGLRISEAQSGEFDEAASRFNVAETKNGKAHWVHVPPLAVEQLRSEFDVSPTAVQSWVRRRCEEGKLTPFTPHDLRRTFATRLAEGGTAPHVVEKCLNHTMQGVMATYNRHDYAAERIEAANSWSVKLQQIIERV